MWIGEPADAERNLLKFSLHVVCCLLFVCVSSLDVALFLPFFLEDDDGVLLLTVKHFYLSFSFK
jgi:hypothetical protein